MQDEHFWTCVRRIGSLLEGLGISYHFTGGIASSFYGEPRFTQDIDIVVRLAIDAPETVALLERLSKGYFINRQVIQDAILAKLFWVKLGSGNSKRDAIQMLKDPEDLEIGQLRLQALRLGLASELSQVEEAAASGKNADELDLNP